MCVCVTVYAFLSVVTCSSLHPLTAFTLLVNRHSEKWEEVPWQSPLRTDPEIEKGGLGGAKSGDWYMCI